MVSELFIDILPDALWPWGRLGLWQKWVPGIFPGGKGGRCLGLTTLPTSCADCHEIWEPQPPGTLRACPSLYRDCITLRGRDSSVGIATRYGLDGPGSNPGWGARFSAPVQTGPGAHPVSYIMGTGSFLGVKRPGRGVDHPPPSSAEVKERAELHLFSSGPSWPVVGWTLLHHQFAIRLHCVQGTSVSPSHQETATYEPPVPQSSCCVLPKSIQRLSLNLCTAGRQAIPIPIPCMLCKRDKGTR